MKLPLDNEAKIITCHQTSKYEIRLRVKINGKFYTGTLEMSE